MMTNDELNSALYQKMYAEQEKYREWLLTLPPDQILQHTYEYTMRQDILLAVEENSLSDRQAKALLKSPDAMSDIYKKWDTWNTGHMEDIWNCIEARANEVVRADFIAFRNESR